MSKTMNRRAFLGTALTFGALCAINPTEASAVTSAEKASEVAAVKEQLDAMQNEVDEAEGNYSEANNAYEQAMAACEECQGRIDDAQSKISSLQSKLSTRATSMYRSGAMSYLDVLLGAVSFGDFATVWDTLNTLNQQDADLTASTKVAKAELQSAKEELDANKQEAADQLAAANSYLEQVKSLQESYNAQYNSLSSEYQQLVEQERAAEAAAAQAQAVAEAATTTNNNGGGNSGSSSSSSGGSAPSSPIPESGSIVDYAYSRLGCPYVYGASGPDSFDCSGLTMWCYNMAGAASLPHYDGGQYAMASSRYSPYEALAGDVLWKSGHVGISVGGISAVEAMGTAYGVVESCRSSWQYALHF